MSSGYQKFTRRLKRLLTRVRNNQDTEEIPDDNTPIKNYKPEAANLHTEKRESDPF